MGNACFCRRDENGNAVAIGLSYLRVCRRTRTKKSSEGLYPFTSGSGAGLSNVWFSYDLSTHSAHYIVSNCPADAKLQISRCAKGRHSDLLCRPYAIDVLIAEVCAREKANGYVESRQKLSQYVGNLSGSNITSFSYYL